MTTKVTVDAHAGWPVRVTAIDTRSDGEETSHILGEVPANEKQEFYVHDSRKILIEELKRPD